MATREIEITVFSHGDEKKNVLKVSLMELRVVAARGARAMDEIMGGWGWCWRVNADSMDMKDGARDVASYVSIHPSLTMMRLYNAYYKDRLTVTMPARFGGVPTSRLAPKERVIEEENPLSVEQQAMIFDFLRLNVLLGHIAPPSPHHILGLIEEKQKAEWYQELTKYWRSEIEYRRDKMNKEQPIRSRWLNIRYAARRALHTRRITVPYRYAVQLVLYFYMKVGFRPVSGIMPTRRIAG